MRRLLHEDVETLAHEAGLRRRVGEGPLPEELGVDQRRVEVLPSRRQGRRHLPHPLDGRRRGRRLVTGPVHEELEDAVLQIGRRVPAPMGEPGGRHVLTQMRLQQGEVDPLVVGQASGAGWLRGAGRPLEKCSSQRAAAASRRAKPSAEKSGNCASHSVNP